MKSREVLQGEEETIWGLKLIMYGLNVEPRDRQIAASPQPSIRL